MGFQRLCKDSRKAADSVWQERGKQGAVPINLTIPRSIML